MRAVIQRVKSASVSIDGKRVGQIGRGLLILLGAREGDSTTDVEYLSDKIPHLRIFEDKEGKMNLSLLDIAANGEGGILVVSQFTLYADTRKGRRPSFTRALDPKIAEEYYDLLLNNLSTRGLNVQSGIFGAKMLVSLENDGPVTIIMDSPGERAGN